MTTSLNNKVNIKDCLALLLVLLVAYGLHAQPGKASNYTLFIGTYTQPGKSEGIYMYDFNAESGECTYAGKSPAVENPSYLAVSSNNKYVYATSEQGMGKGSIHAFEFDANKNSLSLINSVRTSGSPCYVAVDRSNTHVFAANFGGGSLFNVRVRPDGSLDSSGQLIKHEGSSIVKDIQSKPHVHSTVLSPDGKYLLSADLGLDKIFTYRYNSSADSSLSEATPPFIKTVPGSGPRHITFHPNGKFVYVVNEIDGSVAAYRYQDGQLFFLQTMTMLQKDFHGIIEGADIHISADGKFLYATNREESDELVIYKVGTNGQLQYAGRHSTLGKGPRSFAIDPSGKFILVANQNTDEVMIFRRNQATGLVNYTGKKFTLSKPACLKFTHLLDKNTAANLVLPEVSGTVTTHSFAR